MNREKKQDDSLTIRKIMKSEITALVGVLIMVFSFIMFVVTPQYETKTEIALIRASIVTIEKNHMAHMEGYGQELVEIKKNCAERAREHNSFMKENGFEHIEIIKALERLKVKVE